MKLWHKSLTKDERGGATLIGVTFASLLIVILTVAVTLAMAGEVRQSTDASDGMKAYYQATGSVEDQMLAIKQTLLTGPNVTALDTDGCVDSNTPGYDYLPPEVTCLYVSTSATAPFSTLKHDKSSTIDFSNSDMAPGSRLGSLKFEWDSEYNEAARNEAFDDSNLRIPGKDWNSPNRPPVVEAVVTNYSQDTPAVILPSASQTIFMVPQCHAGGPPTDPPSCNTAVGGTNFTMRQGSAVSAANNVANTKCTVGGASGYRCSMEISNLSTDFAGKPSRTVVRIVPRYGDMRYRISARTTSGAQVKIPLQNATVDVTAKIGSSYRRVIHEVPVRSVAFNGNDALNGFDTICKNFQLLVAPGYIRVHQPDGSCPLFAGDPAESVGPSTTWEATGSAYTNCVPQDDPANCNVQGSYVFWQSVPPAPPKATYTTDNLAAGPYTFTMDYANHESIIPNGTTTAPPNYTYRVNIYVNGSLVKSNVQLPINTDNTAPGPYITQLNLPDGNSTIAVEWTNDEYCGFHNNCPTGGDANFQLNSLKLSR